MTFALCSPERSREQIANVAPNVHAHVRANERRTFACCYRGSYTTPVPTRPVPYPTHTEPVPSYRAFSKNLNGNNSVPRSVCGRARVRVTV